MKKILLFAGLTAFIGTSCAPTQSACGSKAQHKKRSAKMKGMAPSMSNR